MREIASLISIVIVLMISVTLLKPVFKKKRLLKINKALEELLANKGYTYSPQVIDDEVYDLYLELEKDIYLIKVLKLPRDNKLVITNRTTWIVSQNTGSLDLRNSIKGISDFLNVQISSDKPIKRLALIYPRAKDILKYVNENEMIFVGMDTDVYGCHIINFTDVEHYFNV